MAEQSIDGELADSIAMLEQILEVMPQDGLALKALYSAYREAGQDVRAFEYLNRLVYVVAADNDSELFSFVRVELLRFEEAFPDEVAAQVARLRQEEVPKATGELANGVGGAVLGESDISEELALAWRLYEENQLTQEEYSSVLHDLTEVSTKELDVPASVLHVLGDRGFLQINRVLNHMSASSGTPMVRLSDFEIDKQLAAVFPPEIYSSDGVIPFGFVGEDLMVGVLNPFNYALIEKANRASGRRCHAYLVEPADYDQALMNLRKLVSDD